MGVPLEQAGGDVQAVEVSAHTGMGMEDLEMALFLEAESMSLSAPRECDGSGTVLEARLDKGQGTVVTGLLRRGSLSVGDPVVAGTAHGRVRRLVGSGGVDVGAVGPSNRSNCRVFEGSGAGTPSRAATEERARRIATAREERAELARLGAMADAAGDRVFELAHARARGRTGKRRRRKRSPSRNFARRAWARGRGRVRSRGRGGGRRRREGDGRPRPVRDRQGGRAGHRGGDSRFPPRIGHGAVGVKVVYWRRRGDGVGRVPAAAIGGPILAFNVRAPSNEVEKLARQSRVTIISRKVIYHLLDAVGDLIGGLAPGDWWRSAGRGGGDRCLTSRSGNKANIVAGCLVNLGSLDGSESFDWCATASSCTRVRSCSSI